MRLENKNALVTGAAQGIGRSVCQRFAEEGARVLVVDMNEEGGEETARLIQRRGRRGALPQGRREQPRGSRGRARCFGGRARAHQA